LDNVTHPTTNSFELGKRWQVFLLLSLRSTKGYSSEKKTITEILSIGVQSCLDVMYKMFGEMLDLPIVDIANEECTRINVEQLASTRATSAIEIALAVRESPGHPYPCKFKGKNQ
jgi:hypothetical protein